MEPEAHAVNQEDELNWDEPEDACNPLPPQQCPRCHSQAISESIGTGADTYWCSECARIFTDQRE